MRVAQVSHLGEKPMRRHYARRPERRKGQVLVLFALMVVVLVGFLALVVDLGFLFGQRRYDQNGADAAAFAAGQSIATNIAAYTNTGGVYISVTDRNLYSTARQYAGLSSTNFSASAPTGTNQNPGLDSSNQLAVSLEYNPGDGSGWCYSPSSPQPPRNPAVPSCGGKMVVDGTGNQYPPLPGTVSPYQIRVTVSSTTKAFFAQVLPGWTGGVAPTSPQTNASAPACIIVSTTGDTTCAQTVISVGGSTSYGGPGYSIPVTTCDTQLNVGSVGQVYQLWGSSGSVCGIGLGSWKETLDFSDQGIWCDGINPDYSFSQALPGPCPSNDQTWNRGGFLADTTYVGNGQQNHDVPMWVSVGFHGKLPVGIKVPTYIGDSPSQTGNEGQNLALGIYCDNGNTVTATTCPINTATHTYFFSQAWTDFYWVCPDSYGAAYNVGCRDASVITWSNPEWVKNNCTPPNCWKSNGSGGPNRVTLANYRDFRIYCGHGTAQNGNAVCNQQPSNMPGVPNNGNSAAYGRYMGPYIVNCLICTGGLNLNGDGVSLSQ